VSPTAPTFFTLNDRLNKAHCRIRELEARETELLAQYRALGIAIVKLTDEDSARTYTEPSSIPLPTPSSCDGFGIGDHVKHTSQRLGPVAHSQAPAQIPARSSVSRTGTTRVKTNRSPYV